MTFRTAAAQKKYEEFLAGLDTSRCVLCEKEPVQVFEHWKIVVNDFPYDRIAVRHDLMVPLRHVVEDGLSPEEMGELRLLKAKLLSGDGQYEYVIEPKSKSIPHHFHLHFIVPKP